MPDKLKPTQFKKGVPRHPNAGRRASTPNITTRLVREAIIDAAARHGYESVETSEIIKAVGDKLKDRGIPVPKRDTFLRALGRRKG